MDITQAKIGRSMKNRANMASTSTSWRGFLELTRSVSEAASLTLRVSVRSSCFRTGGAIARQNPAWASAWARAWG